MDPHITSQESEFCCLFSYCWINIKEKKDLGHRNRDRAWEEPLQLEQLEYWFYFKSRQQSRHCDEPVHSDLHILLLFVRFFRVKEAAWRNVQKLSSNFPSTSNFPRNPPDRLCLE